MSGNAPAPHTLAAQIKQPHAWLALIQLVVGELVAFGFITQGTATHVEQLAVAATPVLALVAYQLAARWRPPAKQWQNARRVEEGLYPLPHLTPWPMGGFDRHGLPLPGTVFTPRPDAIPPYFNPAPPPDDTTKVDTIVDTRK